MPEGHTLHRLAGALDVAFSGTAPLVTSPQGRFTEGAALLSGRAVERAEAYGKHLFVRFAGDGQLLLLLVLINYSYILKFQKQAVKLLFPYQKI